MLIYSYIHSNRLQYILNYIFAERLGISYTVETNIDKFKSSDKPKINYSNTAINGCFHIQPSPLLFECNINQKKPNFINKNSIYLYPQSNGDLPFDLFAACFWLLSRYEEYQTVDTDKHNRFSAKESLAYKLNFINYPIVDKWIVEFKNALSTFFSTLKFKNEQFEILPTIDVDSPWCYKNKGFVRNLGGLYKDAVKGNFANITERLAVLFGIKPDAHYQFDWLKLLYKQLNLKPIFFILTSKRSKYDKSVLPTKKAFAKFVNEVSKFADIGIHLSYYAANNITKIKNEINTLKKLTGKNITQNRQHYLHFKLPNYYQNLISNCITNDYSMGFADIVGFRAGTSRSFLFYNLQTEQTTNLRVHPFSIMDVTLKNYQKKNTADAYNEIKLIIKNIKQVNGKFITLWHNESLSNQHEWKNWKYIYEKTMKIAVNK